MIHIVIKKYFNEIPKEKWDFEHFLRVSGIGNIIFESLEKTFVIVSEAVEKLYNIKPDPSEKIDVASLIYSADNKTLYDRLKEHFNNAVKRDEPATYMFNRCVLILDTETPYYDFKNWLDDGIADLKEKFKDYLPYIYAVAGIVVGVLLIWVGIKVYKFFRFLFGWIPDKKDDNQNKKE